MTTRLQQQRTALLGLLVFCGLLLNFSPSFAEAGGGGFQRGFAQGNGPFAARLQEKVQGQMQGRAENQAAGPAANRGNLREKMIQDLGITPEKAQAMKAIRAQSQQEAQALKSQIQTKRKALMNYMASPNATEAQALSMNREVSTLMSQMGEHRIKTWFKLRGQMTPEQLEKMQQLRKNGKGRLQEHRGNKSLEGGGFSGNSGKRFGGGQFRSGNGNRFHGAENNHPWKLNTPGAGGSNASSSENFGEDDF